MDRIKLSNSARGRRVNERRPFLGYRLREPITDYEEPEWLEAIAFAHDCAVIPQNPGHL